MFRLDNGVTGRNMRRNTKILIIAAAVYVLSILIFTEAENASGHAIGFGNTIWYSLITMTSVGYGDITPTSITGKCIGIFYAFCSIGILVALVGMGIRILEDQIIPEIRLYMNRNHKWYVFTEENDNSVILSQSIKAEEPDCMLVFLGESRQSGNPNVVHLKENYEKAFASLKAHRNTAVFCLGDDPWNSMRSAFTAASLNIPTYFLGNIDGTSLPQSLHQFSIEEALGRWYWQKHPLKKSERNVVLIGCEKYGTALLERALLTNIYESGRKVAYHVFGDATHFRDLHQELVNTLTGNKSDDDSLIFHDEDWTVARDLLIYADRLIFCMDTDKENLYFYSELKKWFVSSSNIHVHLEKPIDGVPSFGAIQELLTPELVIKDALNRQAMLMNDIYNEYSVNPVEWKELSLFYKESNIAAADHLLIKARFLLNDDSLTALNRDICRKAYERYQELYPEKSALMQEMEHRRWMRFSQMYNWKYSPERNDSLRHHPLLLPFDQLPQKERIKDDFAWEMLGKLEF